MSKGAKRDFACVHTACKFKTDKRKAIVTHLIRTHSERKEDFECEYCDTLFEEESVIEEHLYTAHPGFQFRYTCVSRLENVLNKCAQLAADRKRTAAEKSRSLGSVKTGKVENNAVVNSNAIQRERVAVSANAKDPTTAAKPKNLILSESSQKRKASVNESLNNLAKLPRIAVPENPLTAIKQEPLDPEPDLKSEENNEFVNEEAAATFISKPSGLKIKLNLKKIRASCSRESSEEPANCANTTELREMSPLDEVDVVQSDHLPAKTDDSVSQDDELKPRAANTRVNSSVPKTKSQYYDKLEVYHTTDEYNRRCCPFCDYKTTKNTIRVHLSGKHKIYFVMCSLCDYRAAFPYQVQTHGLSWHKVRNIEVIHLAKSYREGVVARLKAGLDAEETTENNGHAGNPNQISAVARQSTDNENGLPNDDSLSGCETSIPDDEQLAPTKPQISDTRVFKPPVCQTSKTDYYNIIFENGTYLYCCSQCDFRTPVRATIYTHKYRHDDKAYKCDYCNFISAPRSNVVHHIRWKHKDMPFKISETVGLDQLKQAGVETDSLCDEEEMQSLEALSLPEEGNSFTDIHQSEDSVIQVKQEPTTDISDEQETFSVKRKETRLNIPTGVAKQQKTIIKVPQYKRSLTSPGVYPVSSAQKKLKTGKQTCNDLIDNGGKMSLNKLYRYNPNGTPKYSCNQCPYACDTHPKMKHHLYRHKPQRYKCPYCNHRKYPRSYVVRHVRDTHRDKPLGVVDLMKTGEYMDPDFDDTVDETDDTSMEICGTETSDNMSGESTGRTVNEYELGSDINYVIDEPGGSDQLIVPTIPTTAATSSSTRTVVIKQEPVDIYTPVPTSSENQYSSEFAPTFDTSTLESPDISAINRPLFNSTPIAGSALFEVSPASEEHPPKKLVKNYDVNTKRKPRYICNFCHYGTENYKTIHNHMYSHEPIKYRCPYCGFKRAPRSFVEKHVREVHKDQPLIVTEVVDEDAMNLNKTRLSAGRTEPNNSAAPSVYNTPVQKNLKPSSSSTTNKTSVKVPASKPGSKVNASSPEMPPLQIPIKPKTSGSSVSPIIPTISVPTRQAPKSAGPPNVTISTSSSIPVQQTHMNSPPLTSVISPTGTLDLPQQATHKPKDTLTSATTNGSVAMPTYKDGGKTTFKTMYKCVFDPETCNHISKDRSKMKQHIFMHVEYKPWSCDYCNMTASQSSHVKNHVRAEHPDAEISFQYKRHNYLEKHIEGFLQKGVFTVPVSEYRFIMDMKGNSKKQQYQYARDIEGYLLCPHCDYRTKSGGMADHVKMKHMQPRFKCHWCDFRAFYRSEVRKHHRKEKGHAHLEFKTQELDLVEVMEEYKEGNGEVPDVLQTNAFLSTPGTDGEEIEDIGEGTPDGSEMDDDVSSNAESCMSDSTALSGSLANPAFLQFSIPYSFEGLDASVDEAAIKADADIKRESLDDYNASTETVPSTVGMKTAEYKKVRKGTSSSLFKCGYCIFSARLRTMVKMHCQKQHPYRKIHVVEPKVKVFTAEKASSDTKHETIENPAQLSSAEKKDVANVCVEREVNSLDSQQVESYKAKIAPLFTKDKLTVRNPMPTSKKSKSLKSVIDQLSSIAKQKGDCNFHTCSKNMTDEACNKGATEEDITQLSNDQPLETVENVCQPPTVSAQEHNTVKQPQPPCTVNSDAKLNFPDSAFSPPVLTNELCDGSNFEDEDERKEEDINPPLLINEAENGAEIATVEPIDTDDIKYSREPVIETIPCRIDESVDSVNDRRESTNQADDNVKTTSQKSIISKRDIDSESETSGNEIENKVLKMPSVTEVQYSLREQNIMNEKTENQAETNNRSETLTSDMKTVDLHEDNTTSQTGAGESYMEILEKARYANSNERFDETFQNNTTSVSNIDAVDMASCIPESCLAISSKKRASCEEDNELKAEV